MDIERTRRNPRYLDDIRRYGNWGESIFEEEYAYDNSVTNVTEIPEYQRADIDFVVTKNYEPLPDFQTVVRDPHYFKVEVKVDTRAAETGNIPYESISHGNAGWCDITKCDAVYVVLADETGGELRMLRAFWIGMADWKEYVADRTRKKQLNIIRNENIVDLLCRIEDMERCGVIREEML